MSPILTQNASEEILETTKAFQIINSDNLIPFSGVNITRNNVNIVKPIQRKMLIHQNSATIVQPPVNSIINHAKPRANKISSSQPILNDDFSRQLENKLIKLKNESKRSSNDLSVRFEMHRKPFVTTVRKGEFLKPEMGEKVIRKKGKNYTNNNAKIYSYESKPKVFGILGAAKKLTDITSKVAGFNPKREIPGHVPYMNVMYERRVVRGSNYAARCCPPTGDGESQAAHEAVMRRQEVLKRSKGNLRGSLGGPYPLGDAPTVRGRKNDGVQTDLYLEELWERPPEFDVACQTDLFLCRPPTPPYIPAKVGVDVATEILKGDLWDFDTEVQPILETLVGKTLEQALLEALEEEELASLREQQERFLEARETEKAEARRLEEQDRLLQEEKERRIAQGKEAEALDKDTAERIAGAMLLQGHIEHIMPGVMASVPCGEGLLGPGFGAQEASDWLTKEVTTELGRVVDSRELLEEIVKEIVETRAEQYRNLYEPVEPEESVAEEGLCPELEKDVFPEEESTPIKTPSVIIGRAAGSKVAGTKSTVTEPDDFDRSKDLPGDADVPSYATKPPAKVKGTDDKRK